MNPSTNQSPTHELLTQQETHIIQDLINCGLACEACSVACLEEKNVKNKARCIRLTRDCADACFQTAKLIIRKSELADANLTVCEEACRLCAEECKKHSMDHCEICAEACASCADSCSRYYNKA